MKRLLLFVLISYSTPITAQQTTKRAVPTYIQAAQQARIGISESLQNYKNASHEDRLKICKKLRYLNHHLHNQLLVAKHEHRQFCKQINEEKKEVIRLLFKV